MKVLLAFLLLCLLVVLPLGSAFAANLTVNANTTFQTIDGFGVNVNTTWWNNGEVKPAIDLLVDQLGATHFRSVIEEMDWEAVNDNGDPNIFNWTAYNAIYSNAKFQGIWNTLKYLNQKGIQNDGLIISFMGKAPDWMGPNQTINTDKEDELVETVASCLYYARFTLGIQFTLISPFNEADTSGIEGPDMQPVQFARLLRKLALKLDAIGMSDVRFHSPEAAGSMNPFFDQIVTDTVVMGKLDLWAIHKYGNSTDGAQSKISSSAYPAKKFWVTETASFINPFTHLGENPSGILIWDGFDSIYAHAIRAGRGNTPPNDSPGIEAPLIAYNSSTHLYTPRKGFYEHAQLFKFVSSGARRIGSTDNDANLSTYAFRHPATGKLSIIGRNFSSSALTVNGTLSNLPISPTSLEFYRTNDTLDLARGTDVAVTSNAFSVSIPANTWFTLTTPVPTLLSHEVKLDATGKILPWFSTPTQAYHEFLTKRWDFIKTGSFPTPGNATYPQYFLHSGFSSSDPGIVPDNWMNPISETVPNWFESARLYYAYSGDATPMALAKAVMDQSLTNGISPANFAWPNMPYTAGNDGEILIRGFTDASSALNKFKQHEIMPGYAGDMGLAYFRMYQYSSEQKYLTAAINTANTLAAKATVGTATQSVWPFSVVMDTGEVTIPYGANFMGCYELFTQLIAANVNPGKNADYEAARTKARNFLLSYPMVSGYWADGHPDTAITSNQNRSNTPKSNVALYMLDFPDFDPNFNTNLPALIAWTEQWFVNRNDPSEAGRSTFYGANVVGEQDDFLYKMDYQTARYAAECAQWYRVSGDAAYKDKAYRALNFVTYCSTSAGRPTESPFSLQIATWWGDCFGECPRMFYQAFKAMPEWAPPAQNHILYSYEVLTNVAYALFEVAYNVSVSNGIEYFRLTYAPTDVTVGGVSVPLTTSTTNPGWTSRLLPGGDYAVTLRRNAAGRVRLFTTAQNSPPTVAIISPASMANVAAPASLLIVANASDAGGNVAKVEFYTGVTKLGEDSAAPYHFAWSNIATGTYSLTAVATDNQNAQTTSQPVTLTVGTPTSSVFGSTSEGTTTDTLTDNSGAYINASSFVATRSTSVTSIMAKVGAITGSYRCAIYSDNNGSPSTLLRQSNTLTTVAAGWRDFPLTSALNVTSGTSYWLATWSNDLNASVSAFPSGVIRYAAYPFGTYPTTVNLTGSGTFTYSIYAVGAATANAAPVCNAGSAQTISIPASTTLSGTVSDDGLPAALTVAWNLHSGLAAVTFGNANALSTSATFTVPGSYTLRLTAFDGAVTSFSDLALTVNTSLTAIQQWRLTHFGITTSTGNAADLFDFDNDGLDNLLEYALGGNPTLCDTAILPTGSIDSSTNKFKISFRRERTELTYAIEATNDLNIWTTLATNPGTTGQTVNVLDAVTLTAEPRRFMRLRVTQP